MPQFITDNMGIVAFILLITSLICGYGLMTADQDASLLQVKPGDKIQVIEKKTIQIPTEVKPKEEAAPKKKKKSKEVIEAAYCL